MRAVFGLVLIVGIGLAGFAVYMAKNQFSAYERELARRANEGGIDTIEIYVANKPMKYGDEIKPEDVRLARWPRALKLEGAFEKQEVLFVPGQPRVMLRAVERNEPLSAVKVTKPGETAGITSLLEPGMRAFAIKVDVTSGVSGFLRPGHRVDVYWTGDIIAADGNRREITKLIEAGVPIVAIDQSADVDNAKATIARTVTVSANQRQVAGLAQAQSTGRLSLSLVGTEDDTVAEDIEIDQDTLLGIARVEAPAPVVKEEEKVCTIRTRRGAEVVEIPIPCTN
ncbi:Flp pilus assembly protein CpaB [Marimonas arenosa]|uniref:Flp pilus assembly protein CpaB n=1 Tax=Marimonas arenosa TaxID=1795305 RepID=A0AAE3WIB5_9RHOB|nr:Flp pilus assembly protein CpaB [Marimonas arenosa]MDQ2092038.1 Flp pilus assembly protein CpaB [Marimonas arenosa]